MRIPLASPDITESDIEAVVSVLRTSTLSLGPKLGEFENAVANYVGARNAVAVSSGTSGLHLCIRAFGIREGDEVIVPSFAFIAVANVVRYERAVPVFVDIEPESMNLDPVCLEAAITSKTKAIIIVHTFGRPAELRAILSIAERHRLFVIEDACEAIGAEYEGKKVGGFGDAGVFAFYPNKQITTGEGGVVITQDAQLAHEFRKLRNQGRDQPDQWLRHSDIGYNYRISDINCALGIAQLSRIERILEQREQIATRYDELLRSHSELRLPRRCATGCKLSWFVYVVRLSSDFTRSDRDWIVQELHRRGIGAGRYFAPIHLQPAYESPATHRNLPVTESIAERTIALPFFNRIKECELGEVCTSITGIMRDRQNRKLRPCNVNDSDVKVASEPLAD